MHNLTLPTFRDLPDVGNYTPTPVLPVHSAAVAAPVVESATMVPVTAAPAAAPPALVCPVVNSSQVGCQFLC